MTEYDRGAYTPHADAPLAFDPRGPRDRQPIPMTLVASSAILVVLVGAVFMAYRHGLHGGGGAMRTVGAPVGAVKTIAAPDARPKDDAAQLDVYAAQNVQATPAFAPPPEAPAPRAAPDRVQMQASTPPTMRIEAPPAAPVTTAQAAPAPAPGQGAPTAISRGAADQDAASAVAHPRPAPPIRTAEAAPAHAATAARPPAHGGALTIAAAEATDATIDAALARSRAAPAAEPSATPARARAAALRTESAEATAKPAHAAAAKASVKTAPKPAALRGEAPVTVASRSATAKSTVAKPAVAHGKAVVQIGAFGSAAIADAQFAKLSSLTGGHGKAVSAVQAGGKTLYRTSVTGFADRASAGAFCARLAAAGHACIVKG